MNETLTTIYERRAVRKYKDMEVSKEQLEQLLDAGRMAPSAMGLEPWKFYLLTSKESISLFSKEIVSVGLKKIPSLGIKKIAHAVVEGIIHFSKLVDFLNTDDTVFHSAPVVIIITANKGDEWAALDIGMCAQNIMLAAKSMGLDSCPVGFGKFIEETKDFDKLGIPPEEEVHLAIILGYGDETPALHERNKMNAFYR